MRFIIDENCYNQFKKVFLLGRICILNTFIIIVNQFEKGQAFY